MVTLPTPFTILHNLRIDLTRNQASRFHELEEPLASTAIGPNRSTTLQLTSIRHTIYLLINQAANRLFAYDPRLEHAIPLCQRSCLLPR